jgi:hypothetical protein
MNKMKATFAFLVMTIAIINVFGYASAQEADTTPPRVVKVDPTNGDTDVKPGVTKALHSINVVVDPRIELLAVVQYLSGYGERFVGLITMPYRRDVMEYFAPFKEHPAVKLFAEMRADNFSFDAPPTAMLHLSKPPDLSLESPFTDYLKTRAGGEERLEEFVKSLRDFARETQFMAFFEAHKGTFLQTVFETHEKLKDIDYIGTLENYYGMKQHSYNIILAPLFGDGAFGPRIERIDGAYDIYNICGPSGTENGFPNFGNLAIIWHEFSHSFVNPTTDKFREQVAQYESLYEPISESMKRQAYPDWLICVNEHIVRAVTTRIAYREFGKEAGEEALQYEKSRSFFYVEALCKRLEQYENQRDKYPTFVDFYPELINVFKELSEKELGDDFYSIVGPINAVSDDPKSVIFIIPSHENDKAVQDKIHAYVKEGHDKFLKDSSILTDEEALKRDLSTNTLMVFGTTTGNLWLAQHIAELPVRIEADKIVADTVYSGANLRFISAWPNPQNPQKGVVIYTAQQAEDVIGIHSVFHGPTDYVIAKDTEVLKAANYKKQNGRRTF